MIRAGQKSLENLPVKIIVQSDRSMKMKLFLKCIIAMASVCLSGAACFAQLPGANGSGLSAAMVKLFGDVTTFTARADVQVLDASQAERVRTPMTFAAADGKLRVEIDMTRMHGHDLGPVVDSLKQLGMDRVVILLRPDKKSLYTVYPNARSYVEQTLSKEEAAGTKSLTVQKRLLGKETAEGHPCEKNQVVVRNGTNVLLNATTWNATDLKDFPVRVLTKEGDSISVMRFQQVEFKRLAARQFEPPTGYAKFNNSQTLMLARSTKALNGKN